MASSYIQVGVTAMRDPVTKEFLPAVPIYVKAKDAPKVAPAMRDGELMGLNDLARYLGDEFKKYMDGLKAIGLKP